MSKQRLKTLELTALGVALCFLLVVMGYAIHNAPPTDRGEETLESPRD